MSSNTSIKYIPERDYAATNYQPLGKPIDFDLCGSCEVYYADLYAKGLTKKPFPPKCNKHVLDPIKLLKPTDFDTVEDYNTVRVALDPIAWGQSELNWEPRWYQEHMLSCTSKRKVYRCGRRLGKTVSMVIEGLHHVATHAYDQVLVIAPYEVQITMFFDEMKKWMANGVSLKNSVSRYTKTPNHRLEFKNGSRILGFSSGASSASRSDKIRGQDANLIIIDEIDYIADDDLDAITAILASHKDCRLIAASTPQGWRKKFYAYATDKDLGFKEFWFISPEAPTWDEDVEEFFKGTYNDVKYHHEINAEFAESEAGVFKKAALDASLEDYNMDDLRPEHSKTYVLGVDWNKSAGTHMTIVLWEGKAKLVKKIIIPESEYLQTDSVQQIIDLNAQWNFKYVFVDAGYGTTQTEMLKKYGLMHPETSLQHKTKEIHMNQSIEIKDPMNGQMIKKPAKQFIVQQTAKMLEDGNLILPESEDTSVIGDKQMGLVQQMRNYNIEAYSLLGLPRYSQGQDHTLVAYTLAVAGLVLEDSDLKKTAFLSRVEIAGLFGDGGADIAGEAKKQQEQFAEIVQSIPRTHEKQSVLGSKGMGSVARDQKDKKEFTRSMAKNPGRALSNYIKRNNIGTFKRNKF